MRCTGVVIGVYGFLTLKCTGFSRCTGVGFVVYGFLTLKCTGVCSGTGLCGARVFGEVLDFPLLCHFIHPAIWGTKRIISLQLLLFLRACLFFPFNNLLMCHLKQLDMLYSPMYDLRIRNINS